MNYKYANFKLIFDKTGKFYNEIDIEDLPLENSLCQKIDDLEMIGYGYTSTIYLDKPFVIKKIYLNDEFIRANKISELLINYLIENDEELRQYSVPFVSYDVCQKTETFDVLLLKFKYMGKNLYDQILNLDTEDFINIINQVEIIIEKFNSKGIKHNDLHPGNIYYENGKVYLADWGSAKLGYEKDDIKSFIDRIFNDIKFAYFFKTRTLEQGKKELMQHLKNIGKYKKFINLVIKEYNYQQTHFPYKPKFLLNKLYNDIYFFMLRKLLNNDPYIINRSNIPTKIRNFIST